MTHFWRVLCGISYLITGVKYDYQVINYQEVKMNLSRKFFGVIYLIGAVANIAMIVFQPEIYREFANGALIPFYQNA